VQNGYAIFVLLKLSKVPLRGTFESFNGFYF